MVMINNKRKMNYLSLFARDLFSDFSFSQMNPSHPNSEQYSELNTKANKSNFMHCVFSYLLQARQEHYISRSNRVRLKDTIYHHNTFMHNNNKIFV